jgi:hypothetical protein
MGDNTDIVERLRSMYYELSRRQASTPFGERSELSGIPELLYEAAIKIQDLQGNEIERLHARVRFLEKRIGDASFMLADWDGYYNPEKKQGNVEELASLVEDAYTALQGRSWRESTTQENTNE